MTDGTNTPPLQSFESCDESESTNSSFAIEKYFDEKLSKFLNEISSIVINSRSRSNSRSNSRNSSEHEQC